ncbi:MAG TPA: response regulator [Gallionellaceae bacterium]|nr:response regulator [Gallionellaceae bacterium]
MLEESLTQFSLKAADALDALWAVMPGDVPWAGDAAEAGLRLQQYLEAVHRLGQAADAGRLVGLQSVCAMLEGNLKMLADEGRALDTQEVERLTTMAERLLGYVMSQGDTASIDALVQQLQLPGWPQALGEDDVAILRHMLSEAPTSDAAAAEEQGAAIQAGAEPPAVQLETVRPPAELQQVDAGMLDMLRKEFAQISEQLNEDLGAAIASHLSTDQRRLAQDNYVELLGRLAVATESIGMNALGAVFSRLAKMISALDVALTQTQHELLQQLPGRVTAYLTWPSDESACAALIDLLADAVWPTALANDDISFWVKALANIEEAERKAAKPEHRADATPQDVSLALPEDINSELLDGLLQELPVQTSAFTSAIERLSSGQGSQRDVERAMRAAHTLKGAANTVGVKGVANLTHHVEDILVALSEAQALPDHALASTLTNAGDCLEAMSEALLGVGPEPEHAQKVLQEVLDTANRIDSDGVASAPAAAMPSVAHEGGEAAAGARRRTEKSEAQAPAGNVLRVPAPVVDEMLRLAGETLISNSQIQERLRLTSRQADDIKKQVQLFQQLVAELEQLVDVHGVAAPRQGALNPDEFDPLEFERFSELHTVTRRLVEAANDAQQMQAQVNEQMGTLADLLEQQQRLHMDSQQAVMRTRLVPVSSVVSRLQRSVRQTCRLLDKQVNLNIQGENTNIDSNVLNELMDPLMHLLRNAVDHGIESAEMRAAAGKPAAGNIELSFGREGNTIVVRCKDDGAGLDYASIRRIAEGKGMLQPEQNPTPDELARLILVNGFSTRDDATQISGRGIGMDVVYNRVLDMKGTLALNSQRGAGLAVELRLPASLLSAHALVVRHRDQMLAISSRGVEDIHYITVPEIEKLGSERVYRVGDNLHTLVKLESLLSLPPDRREADRLGFPVLLTRTESGATRGVLVQEVLSGREVVLKNFGRYVPKIQGMVGAVILGDGAVAPVVDLVELLRTPAQHREHLQHADNAAGGNGEAHGGMTALVVDDSLSARRAASKVMQDAGYQVRTAIDGLDAVGILQNFVPSVILVDMEMPRMNGIELTAHVRDSVRTRNVPVIMITSRSTEKHRKMGQEAGVNVYLTKPFSDDELIEHVARLVNQ